MKPSIIKFPVLVLLSLFSIYHLYSQDHSSHPYNPDQDVRADLKKAIDQAGRENKHVLIQFGGNWCPWCIRFHALVNGNHLIDSLLKADYIYLLANVPKEKNKRDFNLFREFNYPNRFGYPVFVILDGSGKELHIQDSGLLEYHSKTISSYDTATVAEFLKHWNKRALDPDTYKSN